MPTNKKKLSVLNLVLILITLSAISAAAYLWLQNGLHSKVVEPEEPEVSAPVFITLKPFTISLPASQEHIEINKILYVGVVLRVANENQKSVILDYLPEVRSDVLLLVSRQYVNDLKQEKGKTELQKQIKEALSRQYDAKNWVHVDEVLFTDFIIR